MSRLRCCCSCPVFALPLCCRPMRSCTPDDAPQVDGWSAGCSGITAPKAMDNDSIIKMVKAGLGDDLIVQTINAQPGKYTTDADALVALKEAGVSDRVISSMVNKSRRQITPSDMRRAARGRSRK